MFKAGVSKVFRVTSAIALLLACAFGALFVANTLGVELEYERKDDVQSDNVTFTNEKQTTGNMIVPLDVCFMFDCSRTGWNAIQKGNLIEDIEGVLLKYSDQGHGVEFNGYSNSSNFDMSIFLPIDSNKNSDLWYSIGDFKDNFKYPVGDIDYEKYIDKGIRNLLRSDSSKKKILVFIIGSPSPNGKQKKEIESFKSELEESNISFYVIGLKQNGNDYNILEALTDKVYKEVNTPDVNSILTDIFEENAYEDLTQIGNEYDMELDKVSTGKKLIDLSMRLYSNAPFSYEIDKVTFNKDGRDSFTPVNKGEIDSIITTVSISDIEEENGDNLRYHIRLVPTIENQRFYIEKDYSIADIVLPPNKTEMLGLFEWIDATFNINSQLISIIGFIVSFLAFVIPLIVRATRKRKYRNYAESYEARG